MHALVIGATGATGQDLAALLLDDEEFDKVDIFVRRKPDIEHEKLRVHVVDFDQPEQWQHLVAGDVLFSCLGTTRKAAGSKENQWKVDYGYQLAFAEAAKENGVGRYILVSSDYASPDSKAFYSRMKGQLEQAVKQLDFPSLTIFNPPILWRRNSDRPLEVVGMKVVQAANQLNLFRSYQPLPTEILAQAMIHSAKLNAKGHNALKGDKIWQYAAAGFKKSSTPEESGL